MSKNPHVGNSELSRAAVALGRQGGLARRGKPGRKLSSEEAKRIRAIRSNKLKPVATDRLESGA